MAKSTGHHFKEHLTSVWHERDAAVVSALRLIAPLVDYGDGRVLPLLCDVSSRQIRVVSRRSSSKMVRSCWSPRFRSLIGRPSGLSVFTFAIAFLTVPTSSSVNSVQTALATNCCGNLFGISKSSMPVLAFNNERKYRVHRLRKRPLSRGSLPSSSWMFCDSAFLVSSSWPDFMF